MTKWLLPQTEAEKIKAIDEAVISAASTFNGLKVTSESIPLTVSYGIATIHVSGLLTKERDAILDFFGVAHTPYSEITSQVREAESRGAKKGVIHFDSPGGQVVTDQIDAMDAIRKSSVEWRAQVGDLCASAAYMLASQAKGGIYASSDLSLVGSIGVAASAYVSSYRKDIANTDSPNKRPDVSTEDGVSAVREELDDIYNVLAERIAKGRGVSVSDVKDNYGKGAVMTAKTALSKKIIDGIDSSKKKQPASKTQAAIEGVKTMDIETLKRENPAVYQAVLDIGIAQERKRSSAHAQFAKKSKLFEAALDDIEKGADADNVAMFKHLDAATRGAASDARGNESVQDLDGDKKPAPESKGSKEELDEFTKKFLSEHKSWEIEVRQ